jgi:hypothetical protein
MDSQLTLILNLLSLSALLWFFNTRYRNYRAEILRYDLQRARLRLVEAAHDGLLPFDHPACLMTRQYLRHMIRFGHEFGIWHVGMLFAAQRLWWGAEDERDARRFDLAVDSLESEARQVVDLALADVRRAFGWYLLHTSLLTFPFAVVLSTVLSAISKLKGRGGADGRPAASSVTDAGSCELHQVRR